MEQSKSLLDAGLISGAAAAFMGYVPDIAAVLAVILLLFRIANEAINLIRQRARMRYYKEKQNAEADD